MAGDRRQKKLLGPTLASESISFLPDDQVHAITSKSTRTLPENTVTITPSCTVERSVDADRLIRGALSADGHGSRW